MFQISLRPAGSERNLCSKAEIKVFLFLFVCVCVRACACACVCQRVGPPNDAGWSKSG